MRYSCGTSKELYVEHEGSSATWIAAINSGVAQVSCWHDQEIPDHHSDDSSWT